MSALMDELRFVIAEGGLGVTLTDTHLTVRGTTGIATFVLTDVRDWGSDECAMCGVSDPGGECVTVTIGDIAKYQAHVCSDCRCPK